MCFYSNTSETKITKKPIRVYKVLENNNMAPNVLYKYVRGLNTPEYPEESFIYGKHDDVYVYSGGWLHALKHARGKNYKHWLYGNLHVVVMFVPKGCRYHDAGIDISGLRSCTNDVISKALYWPKNWFDYLVWYIKSL